MNLVAYSDSDDSDNDVPQTPDPTPRPNAKSTTKPASKPSFQKVVDRSNPGRIRLNLPSTPQVRADSDGIQADAPPAKKLRVGSGGGAFSGFNAMLPAPKKPKVDAASGGVAPPKRMPGKGLGVGINLKTGAEPAFQRASRVEEDYDEDGNPISREKGTPVQMDGNPMHKEDFRALLNLPPPKQASAATVRMQDKAEPPVAVGSAPVPLPIARPKFMPLSVARGKKKPTVSRLAAAAKQAPLTATTPSAETFVPGSASSADSNQKPASRPRVSIFSVSQEDVAPKKAPSNGQYQPLLYGVNEAEDTSIPESAFEEDTTTYASSSVPSTSTAVAPARTDLTDIASQLNLSAAERRQLFGRKRHGPDLAAASIIEFNTDKEYEHNERLRQQGETVQHNALKSITGTGKNSLRSLVSMASTQKDALEEHFAAGKRNKREAGNKYGW